MDYFRARWLRKTPDLEVQREIFQLLWKKTEQSDEQRIRNLINALKEKGQSVDFRHEDVDRTPLHLAARNGLTSIVMLLVSAHAKIERKDSLGFSAMHYAISEGHKETVKCLHDLKASVQVSLNGKPALHLAFDHGRQQVADYLLDLGLNLDAEDDRYRTPVALASFNGIMSEEWIMKKIKYHIGLRRSKGSDFLVCAAEAGRSKIIKYLIEDRGVDVNIRRKNGQTALMAACQNHRDEQEHYKQIVKLLVKKSIHVNTQDAEGNTALHFACKRGALELVKALLTSGANPNLSNKKKETPLHLAMEYDYEDIQEILSGYEAGQMLGEDP